MNPVVHFEMPYDNRQRMAAFYQSAFGWQTQMLGEEMGHYVVAHTTETVKGMVHTPGTINGGSYERKTQGPDKLLLQAKLHEFYQLDVADRGDEA